MKCGKCGYDNLPGTRFCENCGSRMISKDQDVTEVLPPEGAAQPRHQRICPQCGSLIDGSANICMRCGFLLNRNAVPPVQPRPVYREEPEKGGILKMVLLGIVIGLAVLGIIFGVMYVINERDDEEEASTDVTVPIETEQQTEPAYTNGPDDSGGDDWQDQNDYRGSEDYSTYIDEPESRLYSDNVPIFFPDSNSRQLNSGDVRDMSSRQIQKALNDIYAKHGYRFKNQTFGEYYYRNLQGYRPYTRDMEEAKSSMNSYERANLEFLGKAKTDKEAMGE